MAAIDLTINRWYASSIDLNATKPENVVVVYQDGPGFTSGQTFSYDAFYRTVWPGEALSIEQFLIRELTTHLFS